MRPLELQLQAFGPFAEQATVDFTALGDAGLFCVTGPTGAGKTSLLDGLCYALYGAVPGARHITTLRSHHAAPHLPTQARLRFTVGGEDFQVLRRPEQERPKRRGSGVTTQRPTAVLLRADTDGWTPVCEGVAEVAGVVRDLLGLDAEQFWQVVVLPQGQVQRALHAGAEERQRLLSTLFSTARFARATDVLSERARTTAEQVQRREAAQVERRVSAGLAWQEVDKEVDGELVAPADAPADPDVPDVPDVPDDQVLLDDLVRRASKVTAAEAERVRRARSDERDAAAQLSEARQTAQRWRRREQARGELHQRQAWAAEVERLRARVALLERAESCRPLVRDADETAAAHTTARRELQVALRALPDLTASPGLAELVQLVALLRRATPEDAHADVLRRLVAALERRHHVAAVEVERSRAAEREEAQANEQLQREAAALARAAGTATALADLRAQLARTEEAESRAIAALQDLPACTERLHAAIGVLEAARATVSLTSQLHERELHVLTAERAHQDARGRALDLREQRLDALAAALAEDLDHGCACPVCGSLEHPRPAALSGTVSETEVAEAESVAEELQADLDGLCRQRDVLNRELQRARHAAGGSDVTAAEGRCEQARTAHTETGRRAQLLPQLRERTAELAAAVEGLREQRRNAQAVADAARAAAERHRHLARELRGAVGRTLGGDDAEQLLALLERLSRAVDELRTVVDDCAARGRDRRSCESRLHAALAETGFDDVDALRVALGSRAEAQTLRQQVQAHDDGLAEARAVLRSPELRDLPETAPVDVDHAVWQAERTQHEAAEAVARHATVEAAARTLRRLADEHRRAQRQLDPLVVQARQLAELAELCRGTRGNRLRMSLERYVLAAYLEEVTERASGRLLDMSAGRYRLAHTGSRGRGNRASGLDLRVIDAWTGQEREVGTLSGGETFQASLALALALAETVRAHSGGLELDALFVDEGFGTLDPDALDQALDELDRLREGGRLVGVISHVQGLADRVTTTVRVTKGQRGSHVALSLPGRS